MAINVECCHTSGCCYTYSVSKKKSDTMNQVRLPCGCCTRDDHPEWWWCFSFHVLLHNGVAMLGVVSLGVAEGQQ